MQRRVLRFRPAAGVTLTAAMVLTVAGCSSESFKPGTFSGVPLPSKDPKATVRVLSILDPKADNVQPVIDAFEKAHPNIDIKWETSSFDDLNSTIDSHVANKGGDPDVYWADQPRVPALAARGEAADLSEVFSRYESAFDPTAYKANLYKGKVYALPIANSSQLLYYNKDLLDKAGLKPPSADVSERTTWEQLTKDAAKAKAAGAQYGFLFGQPDRYYQLQSLPVSLGGSVGASGPGRLKPEFTSDAWVRAMKWYGSLYRKGISPRRVPADQTDPAFVAGKAAYMVEGPWLLPMLEESKVDWGVAPHPKFARGKPVTATGSWSLALNPFSKEKQAAEIFMKWMAVDNGGGYIKYRSSPELAANTQGKKLYFKKPVFSSPEGKDAARIMQHETTHTAVNRVSTVGYIEFERIVGQAFSDIANGADPKTALKSASQQLRTAWIKYQGTK
jgi:ABC-type glycerol-3-phosphate transport system substrate-binding protein